MSKAVLFLALAACAGVPGRAIIAQQQPAPDFGSRRATYIKASNPGEDDHFGAIDTLVGVTMALSKDGTTLAVGAPFEDSAATGVNGNQRDESSFNAGAVYVFARAGGTWSQQAYIKASSTGVNDQFGFSVAMSADGNTLAVGAPFEDSAARGINGNHADNTAEDAGAVYIFGRRGGMWSQQAYVKASNADGGDQFGWSLAIDDAGSTLTVGAPSEASNAQGINGNQADNSALEAGVLYVFTRAGAAWSQQAYIKGSNTEGYAKGNRQPGGDLFAFCVALSGDGNTLAACGYDEDGGSSGINGVQDNEGSGTGCAYVFFRKGTTWSQEAYIKASTPVGGSAFGSSIAMSGDGSTLAIGAVDEDGVVPAIVHGPAPRPGGIGPQSAGALYVFAKTKGVWAEQAYVKPFNIRPVDQFGLRLAFTHDGNVLAVASPLQTGGGQGSNANPADFSADHSGAVYIFTRTAGRWSQHSYLKAPNAAAFDEYGSAVALSGDGKTLAIAAHSEDGGSAGVGGNHADNSVRDAGAVFVY